MATEEDILKRYVNTLPRTFKPDSNEVILALLLALSEVDAETENQVDAAKDQLFVRTATGKQLDKLANSLGVSRPQTLGLTDTEFQNLIPNLSLKPKQIKKSFYDTADVFWGPSFSRANLTSSNAGPFNLLIGDTFTLKVDGKAEQTVKILTGDIAISGAATASEVQAILSKFTGVTVTIQTDPITLDQFINVRTNTPGSVGSVEFTGGTGVGSSKVDFTLKEYTILDLSQRVSIYNINPNELLIEIPAIIPTLRRTLKGSHHFHADSTLEPPRGTTNTIWAGSFLFNPDGSSGTFTVTSQRSTIQQVIQKNTVVPSLLVADTSLFTQTSGFLIFGFGSDKEEQPVRFRGVPNSNTILLDPAYTFQYDHAIGTTVNVISDQAPYTPKRSGTDLAVYLTSPSGSRTIVQGILDTLKAAGIIINFVVLAPSYKYIIDNPYLDTDDAPSSS